MLQQPTRVRQKLLPTAAAKMLQSSVKTPNLRWKKILLANKHRPTRSPSPNLNSQRKILVKH